MSTDVIFTWSTLQDFLTQTQKTQRRPKELVKCITECAPGPHAFLLVMKVEKYTEHEMDVVNIILKYFSEEVLKYTTVLFTRGDDLEEGMKIEEWVKQNSSLNDLVQKCGGRCHVFDNKYWKNSVDEYRNNQNQIRELMKTIDQTVSDNEGKFYTNDLLKKTGEQIEQEKTRLRATSSGDMSDEDIHKEAKDNVFKKLWLHIKGNPVGIILGGLLGVTVMVPLLLLALPCTVIGAVVGAVRAVRNKIKRRCANTTQAVAEQQLMEQETEDEEEQEEEVEQENMVRPPEMETLRRQAENTLNEWYNMYRGLGYKKLQ
ncbi:hypothetical protein NL108_013710 [Boleophthalmus pectinirostris]|nr:hypothetical protein NL108_013710 [Boleophthalmus pectinirostris]